MLELNNSGLIRPIRLETDPEMRGRLKEEIYFNLKQFHKSELFKHLTKLKAAVEMLVGIMKS